MATNDMSDNAHWQNHEIDSLLKIWSRKEIQNKLESMHQNLPVYEKISTELSESGINKSAVSCRDKIKKLKFKYRRIREKKGHRKAAFRFYDTLRSVLGDNVDEVTDSTQMRRTHNHQPISIKVDPSASLQAQADYDHMRYSPNFASNDSIVLSDSDDDSEYDLLETDEDYIPTDSGNYDESQPISSTSNMFQNPPHVPSGNNMSMYFQNGRVVTSSRQETPQRDDSTLIQQNMHFSPINAARAAMKRRHGMMGRGCGFGRGMMGPPFGVTGRGRGHHGLRGGKFARMEQAFENMLNKVMQGQKDVQEQFLSSNEKQHQQHLQFELKKQELIKQEREQERKHQMEMFQLMLTSVHGENVHLSTRTKFLTEVGSEAQTAPQSSVNCKIQKSAMSVDEVKTIFRTADAVCFDVDSTVLKDEGIDELAAFCGQGQKVAEWTKKAMGGGISFRVALTERLNIIKPSRQQLTNFIAQHPPQFSDGISDLVTALRAKGKSVYLVSGGFRTLIEPAAKILGIAPEHIFANKLKFYYTGEYAGFDESQPTSDSGGKPKVMQVIKDRYDHNTLVMVGDGATDLEASPPADAFIGYGGNVCRESVKAKAAWFVTDFQELIRELDTSS